MVSEKIEDIQEFEDKAPVKVITKKDLNHMAFRSLFLQSSFNYERMQAVGWLFSVLPGLKKIHKNRNDLSRSMKMHTEFFNTNPVLVTFIMGIVLAMEEKKEPLPAIRAVKIATMGPVGGIGDALIWFTLLPLTAGIGASFALGGGGGGIIGALFFLLTFNLVHFSLRFGLIHLAYRLGIIAVSKLAQQTRHLARAASIIGLSVIGGLVATYVRFSLPLTFKAGETSVNLQSDVFDRIMPALLPALYTLLCFYLISRKRWTTTKAVLLTVCVGIAAQLLKMLFPEATG